MGRKVLFIATVAFFLLYTFVPILQDLPYLSVKLVDAGTAIVLLMLYPRSLFSKPTIWFVVYIMALVLLHFIGWGITVGIGQLEDSMKILIEAAWILPSILIAGTLCREDDEVLYKGVAISALVALAVSYCYLIPLAIKTPMLFRSQLTQAIEYSDFVMLPGMPGYTLLHSYVIVLPGLIYLIKSRKLHNWWNNVIFFVMFLCTAFMVYCGFISTTLVLLLACICISAMIEVSVPAKITLLCLYMLVAFYILSTAFDDTILYLQSVFEGTPVSEKIKDFSNLLEYGDASGGTIEGRHTMHSISIDSFLHNIITGSNTTGMTTTVYDTVDSAKGGVGGHSQILDRLGGMGLFGTLPWIMMIVTQCRDWFRNIDDRMGKAFFILGIAMSVVILYSKGLFGQECWCMFFVVLPCLLNFSKKTSGQ